MPRYPIKKKREILPDPLFSSKLVCRLINKVMRDGKKSVAQKQVYLALKQAAQNPHIAPILSGKPDKILEEAVNIIGPRSEVKPRRIGGASYQIPVPVRSDRRISLALRWLIEAARKRDSKIYRSFGEKLAAELVEALQNQGEAIKKRDQIHRMAEANRAFAHFRW